MRGIELFTHHEEDCEELRLVAIKHLGTTKIRYGGCRPQYGEQKNGDPASFYFYDKTHYRHQYFIQE